MTLSDITNSLVASLGANAFAQTDRTRADAQAGAAFGNTANARAANAATGSDAVTRALDQADQRIEQQRSSTEVRLSAFGQLRSSVAQLQESAAALANGANGANNANAANTTNPVTSGNGANTANTVNAADASRNAATRFVNAFNQARSTANQVTQGSSGALAGDGRAATAASQLNRTLSDDSRQQLRSIGINANQDGTLSIDQQRFNQALQDNAQGVGNALARVGTQVQQSTTRQLEDNGAINRSIDTLSARASQLQTQQAAQQQLAQQFQQQDRSQQQESANQFSAVNAINASGIAAYQKIFSL